MPRKCLNHTDQLHLWKGNEQRKQRNIPHEIKKMYMHVLLAHYVTKVRPAPQKICKKCCLGLHNWLNKRSCSMPFAIQ